VRSVNQKMGLYVLFPKSNHVRRFSATACVQWKVETLWDIPVDEKPQKGKKKEDNVNPSTLD
jgi:hypothetical protein